VLASQTLKSQFELGTGDGLAVLGARYLGCEWADGAIDQLLFPTTPSRRISVVDVEYMVKSLVRTGDPADGMTLVRILERFGSNSFISSIAWRGMATRGGPPALLHVIDSTPSIAAASDFREMVGTPERRWLAAAWRVRAIGEMAAAAKEGSVRQAGASWLTKGLTDPNRIVRDLSLRKIAQIGEISVREDVERFFRRELVEIGSGPLSAEWALALARVGSPLARDAIHRSRSGAWSDLWIRAVAVASLPPAERSLEWPAIVAEVAAIPGVRLRDLFTAEVGWLKNRSSLRGLVWLDPSAGWTRTELDLRPGQSYRVHARGILAIRSRPSLSRSLKWDAPDLPPEVERAIDVRGLERPAVIKEAFADGYAAEVLQVGPDRPCSILGFIGRLQEFGSVEMNTVHTAQETGRLLVRVDSSDVPEPSAADTGLPRTDLAVFRHFGLILLQAETVDGSSVAGRR
jgi:hypothetical protein